MGRIADIMEITADMLSDIPEDQMADAIHDLESIVLSAPPETAREAALMLRIVRVSLEQQEQPEVTTRAIGYVADWIMG